MKVKSLTDQAGKFYKWADGRTDGPYQVHYLPASLSYVVDNNIPNSASTYLVYTKEWPRSVVTWFCVEVEGS